jgi:Ca2+-binding RTX toxin-like protein
VAQVTLGEGSDRVLIEGRGPGGMAPRSELTGGEGRDRLEAGAGGGALSGGTGADVLVGGVGSETLRGGPGGDRMAGRGSGDTFVEGVSRDGRDSVSGGDGFDTVSYRFRRKPVRADLAGDRDDGERGERDRIDRDVESLIGSAAGDRLTGNSRPNLLQGSRGNDRIAGRNGPDILEGGRGSDRIFARDGDSDTVTCGRGRDRASLDGLDHLPAFASCESRRRNSVARAVLAERELMVFGSTATVPVNCPADARPRCRGTLSVLLDGRRIGEGAFSISRGGGDDLEVGLPADVAARIAREGFVRVTVVLRTRYRRLRAVARLGAALVAQ